MIKKIFGGLLAVAVVIALITVRGHYAQGVLNVKNDPNISNFEKNLLLSKKLEKFQQVNGLISAFMVISVIVIWRMRKKEKTRISHHPARAAYDGGVKHLLITLLLAFAASAFEFSGKVVGVSD